MSNQTASNVLVAIKREGTYGTEESAGSGASQLRVVDGPGLKLTRANIQSNERRRDQQGHMGRLGGKMVEGTFNTEINPGYAFDLLCESLLRGSIEALAEHATIDADTQLSRIVTPTSVTNYGYTVEQYDADIDESEVFRGCRVTGCQFAFQPGEVATAAWSMMGLDRALKATGASPHFTSPDVTSTDPLIADDATISYAGSEITVLTGLNIQIRIDASGRPVIGSAVGPDVFMNRMVVTGDVTGIRQDLTQLTAFDAETEFEIKATLRLPGTAPQPTFAIRLPNVKIMDIDAPFAGGDGPKLETRQFLAAPASGSSTSVELYTSTETPTAV